MAPRGAPRLVRSGCSWCSGRLSRRRGAFPDPGGLRSRLYWVAARGTRRPAENRAHCACRWPPPRQGRWARSASYPFGAPRWGCPWRVPPVSVLGCVRCGGWRVWTRSLTRLVFRAVRRSTEDSAGAPELFCGDTDTSPCGSEDATPGSRACVRVLVCPGWVGRAGLPGAFWCASPVPLAALSFCLARPPPSWGCPFLGPLFALPLFPLPCPPLILFFFLLLPRAPFVSCCLWFPAPGALGLGAFFFLPPPPGLWFFFPSFFVRPLCLWLSLVSGPGCPGPCSCVLFVSLASRFSALRVLSPGLCFPPRRWLLPGGCCAAPPFLSRGFRRCGSVLRFFVLLSFVVRPCCLWLSLVSGPGCPGPWRCVFFVLLASRFSARCALSPLLCFLPARWRLPGGCCPPPPFVSRIFRRCRSVLGFYFFSLFRCAPPLSLAFSGFRLRVPWALALCVVCFVGLPFLGSPCALASCMLPAWPLAAPWWFLPPPPLLCLAVFLAATRCSVFFSLLLCSCLLAWRSSAVLAAFCPPPPPPGACVVPCAVWCCGSAALPSGVLRCRVAVFRATCRAVVPRLAVLWAAACCAVFVGVFVCVSCCAVGCCCVFCCVSGRAVWLGRSRCGLLSGYGLCCRVLCCAVCPWVRCCAALLRVVPPGVVLLCAVLFRCARLVPLLVVRCPLALPVPRGLVLCGAVICGGSSNADVAEPDRTNCGAVARTAVCRHLARDTTGLRQYRPTDRTALASTVAAVTMEPVAAWPAQMLPHVPCRDTRPRQPAATHTPTAPLTAEQLYVVTAVLLADGRESFVDHHGPE